MHLNRILTALNACCLVPLVLALIAGCSTTGGEPEGEWLRAEVSAPSENVLRIVSQGALERMGYKRIESDPTGLQITSNWRESLAPFSGDGYRVRAEIVFDPVRTGVWGVEVRVKRQYNMSMVNPNDPAYAKWEWGADDTDEARVLLQRLKSKLGLADGFQVGDAPIVRPGS